MFHDSIIRIVKSPNPPGLFPDMRIHRCLPALILLAFSPMAFARGGPGGFVAAVLAIMLTMGVISGVVTGIALGRFFRNKRKPWLGIAALSPTLYFAWVSPSASLFGWFPVIAFGGPFLSAFVIARGKRRPTNKVSSWANHRRPTLQDCVLRWLAWSYLFWVTVSFLNFQLIGFLAFPPAVFLFSEAIEKFLPFLLPPLGIAIGTAVVVTVCYLKFRIQSSTDRSVTPLIFNGCILLVFFSAAEIYSRQLMADALQQHHPDQFYRQSFLSSVLSYDPDFRGAHAGFDENGASYIWSYAERRFILSP